MSGIQLIATDLDGTLLDDEKRLSAETVSALTAAASRGIQIVPATGRYYQGIPEEIRRLPFLRYCITINGAEILDVDTGEAIHRAEIPLDEAQRIWDYLAGLPVIFDCYQYGRGWIPAQQYGKIDEYTGGGILSQITKKNRIPLEDFRGEMYRRGDSVQKIQMFFKDLEARAAALISLPKAFPELSVSSASFNNIELNAGGATKGQALGVLMHKLDIPATGVMAFGDGTNDIDLLQTAGTGVAMGNAEPAVKAAAAMTAPTNNQQGVAAVIRRMILD